VIIENLETNDLGGFTFILKDLGKNLFKILAYLPVMICKYLMIHPYGRRTSQTVQKIIRSSAGIANDCKPLINGMAKQPEISTLEHMHEDPISLSTHL
jgi:hypothetical protein